MCGIWLSLGLHSDRRAIDIIAHRGPDGEGWKEFHTSAGPLKLGHRRLAIIDLHPSSDQPLSYGDGRFWIVYNGELYNYLELREELLSKGHTFSTHSDTEVILAAWAEWKEAALSRFIGMFAFAIYDAHEQEVVLVRDPYGIKPLYFFQDKSGIRVASEIKQFYATGELLPAMHAPLVLDFLLSSLTDHDRENVFLGVRQLRGGEWVRFHLSTWHHARPIEPKSYVTLPVPDSLAMSQDEAAATFYDLLKESVRIHLRSDVTIGSCLSGGLDSSAIVCLMAELLGTGERIHTVSACYESDKAIDERDYIEAVLAHTGAKSSYVFPQAKHLIRDIERMTWHQDLPIGSTSIFAQWCVFGEARRQGLKVMLDGQGADEQLAGYHGGFPIYLAELASRGEWHAIAQTVIGRWIHMRAPFMPMVKKTLLSYLRTQKAPLAFLNKDYWEGRVATMDTTASAMKRDAVYPADSVGRLCRAMVRTTSLPNLLRFEDRNSMAFGIEARVPFLDPRLVNFTLALGSAHKYEYHTTKSMMRRGLHETLPHKILSRHSKLGFPTPEERWFKGPLKPFLLEALQQTLQRHGDLFDQAAVHSMAKRQLNGEEPYNGVLWRIAHLGIWSRVIENKTMMHS